MNFPRRNYSLLVVILAAIFLIAVKWKHLFLPCYWDEAYPYAHAIRYLYDHQLSLLPSGLPEDLSKGHPAFFSFSAALWMRMAGTSLFAMHLFPLLISVSTLFVLYRFGKTFFNAETGMFAALLLATRTMFVAQSSQLLPETLITLLTLLSLHAWLNNRKWIYVLWCSLLVLTKESGLVLPAVLCLWEIISMFRYKLSLPGLIRTRFHTALPFAAAAVFFTLQKIQSGWFFYPQHIGYITFSGHDLYKKLWQGYSGHLFIFYGGIITTLITIIALVFLYLRKIKLSPLQRRTCGVLALFLAGFLIFSALNFYSPRYILCLFPLWYVLAAFITIETFKRKTKLIPVVILSVISIVQVGYMYDIKTFTDADLGYAEVVQTQKDAISWCKEHNYKDQEIFAVQLSRAMTAEAEGFVTKEEAFTHITSEVTPATDLFIFTCNMTDEREKKARELPLKTLVKFTKGKAWTEICGLQR